MERRLRTALLFEAAVGLVTLAAVMLFQEAGIAFSALLVFRPLLWRTPPDDDRIRAVYRDALRISLGIMALFVGAVVAALLAGLLESILIPALLLPPAFMLVHGLTGSLLLASRHSAGAERDPLPH